MMVVVVVVVVVVLSAVVRPSAPHMRNEAPFDAWRSPLTGSNCQLSSNHCPVLEIAAFHVSKKADSSAIKLGGVCACLARLSAGRS